MDNSRKDYIEWDKYFMAIAKLSAMRSKDPSTQVGSCIVSKNNRILSTGYNGTPNTFCDSEFPWGKEGLPLESKYLFVCHSELNAIMNFKGNNCELENSRIYVSLFPCNDCAKLLIQAGVKEVIYLDDRYADKNFTIAAKKMFDTCGVKYRQLKYDEDLTIKFK
ncbi:MAG: dCMP deaminase family protein [Clostridia bacterium]